MLAIPYGPFIFAGGCKLVAGAPQTRFSVACWQCGPQIRGSWQGTAAQESQQGLFGVDVILSSEPSRWAVRVRDRQPFRVEAESCQFVGGVRLPLLHMTYTYTH